MKYDLNVKGLSGKLKTTVIGDYLKHGELLILENERKEYQLKKAVFDKQPTTQVKEEQKKAAEEYIPVDFDAYSIPDKATLESEAKS